MSQTQTRLRLVRGENLDPLPTAEPPDVKTDQVEESTRRSLAEFIDTVNREPSIDPMFKAYLVHTVTQIFGDMLTIALNALGVRASMRAQRLETIVTEMTKKTEEAKAAFAATTRQLADKAYRDTLTGLLNKETFMDMVRVFLCQSTSSRWCALGVIDLTKFSRINNRFGHQVGDKVLAKVAEILGRTIRVRNNGPRQEDADIHARFGGDEFVFFLPRIPGPDAAAPAKVIGRRFLMALEEFDWSTVDPVLTDCKIGADVGIACLRLGNPESRRSTVEDLFKLADDLMYRAKLNGLPTQVDVLSSPGASEEGPTEQ